MDHSISEISPRERVRLALQHQTPDRQPVDFLATQEIWKQLQASLNLDDTEVGHSDYFDPAWEAILRHFEIDCRLLSYDQFCNPPTSILHKQGQIDWWQSLARSTPNRMWREQTPDGDFYDIWGCHRRIVEHMLGAYEDFASWPLVEATSVDELKQYPWPDPDWWDFSPILQIIEQLDQHEEYHFRFRIGSIFETAWQLRGMQEFLVDLADNPAIPVYIMERLTDILVENTRRVLDIAGDRLDMVYFYDDVATQNSLMISPKMWRKYVRPLHTRLIEVAKAYDKPVMYHCDGAIYRLIPELIEMGIDLLNPIQTDAKGMEADNLKQEFGQQLAFHGGIDIIKTLPRGTPEDVAAEVQDRKRVLGADGGYILASSHHIQPDTPLTNVLSMYNLALR